MRAVELMRRLKATSEQARALEASNEHQEKVKSKDIRGSAVQSSGVPSMGYGSTAESKAGWRPQATGMTLMGIDKSVDKYQQLKEFTAARKIQKMVRMKLTDSKQQPIDSVFEEAAGPVKVASKKQSLNQVVGSEKQSSLVEGTDLRPKDAAEVQTVNIIALKSPELRGLYEMKVTAELTTTFVDAVAYVEAILKNAKRFEQIDVMSRGDVGSAPGGALVAANGRPDPNKGCGGGGGGKRKVKVQRDKTDHVIKWLGYA